MKKKLAELLRDRDLYVVLAVIMVDAVIAKQILNANGVGGSWWIIAGIAVVEGLLFAVLWRMRKKGVSLEEQFLLMGIVLGGMFIVLLPPGQSPDDINHFRRAYGISDGVFIAEQLTDAGAAGSSLPVEVDDALKSMPEPGMYNNVMEQLVEITSGETSGQVYTNTALYNFVCYLPQVFAALIGKVLGMSVMGIAYLMEIFNFALWMVLLYFAIKILPKFKTIVLFIALLPITLQEATSMAPDALTIGLSIFMIAYILYLAYTKRTVMRKTELALLYILAIVIGFCKIVYFPLVLLYLVIPKERFGGGRARFLHLVIIAVITLVLNLTWLSISSGMLIEFNPGVDSKAQVMNILGHPLSYAMVMAKTVVVKCGFWLSGMLGMTLGSWAFNLPEILSYVSFGMLVLLIAQRDEALKMRKFDRWIFAGVFAMVILLIFTSIYVQWTAVGADVIDGIQGRYFLPILLLVPLIFNRVKDKRPRATLVTDKAVMCYGVLVNVVALTTIFAQNI